MNYHRRLFSTPEWWALRLATLLGRKDRFFDAYAASRSELPDIARLRDVHAGRRCFILGGGPSLRKIEPALLRDEITFGVNGCFLIFDWLGFQPTYYTVEDTFVFEDRWREIRERVDESSCLFPIQFRIPEFHRPDFRYFRAVYDLDEREGWPRFSTDASKVVWIGGTVTYVCLQLAYYMGIREVYLVGMDHSYVRPDHVSVRGSEWRSGGPDPNHFHPDYFGPGKRWHDPRVDRMEKAYLAADVAYRRAAGKIRNATVGGALEVFERVQLDSLSR